MASLEHIDGGKNFDFGKTSDDYAKYRDIYPEEFYRKIIDLGLCTKGQRVLDLGTGTGVLPRNMYKYGAVFTGADISENQIKEARRLSAENNMNIEYIVSPAEKIDYPDSTFDTVTACQCFAYFNAEKVLPEIHRMLKPGGHLCIMFMDYLPYESKIAAMSEQLILKYNPDWTGGGYKAKRKRQPAVPEYCEGLYETENAFGYDISVKFTRESWNGRMKTCRGIGASELSPDKIAMWEKEHMEYLNTVPECFEIPHWVNLLNLRKI